jgi:hypothetical protein
MEFTSNAVSKNVIFLINQRLLDLAKQEFDAVLSVSSKCYFNQYNYFGNQLYQWSSTGIDKLKYQSPLICGGVRVAHLSSFRCYVFRFVCLRPVLDGY